MELTPPYMWCHRACKVGQNAVVLSRPTKYNIKRAKRRRASSQSTTASGCHRISSPDSPQDRRAVAAAFSNSVLNQANRNQHHKFGGHSDDGGSKRKPLLLSSKSLDEHDQKSSHDNRPPPNSLQVTSNSSLLAHSANTASTGAPSKSSELHRACSIPAIIVGEIPKLIVTSSNDPQQNQQKVSPSAITVLDDGKFSVDGKNASTSRMNSFSSSNSVFEDSPSNSLDASLDQPEYSEFRGGTKSSSHTIAVHEYYLSLLKEEYNRLKIVELAENLVQVDAKLDAFLSERVPYLSSEERQEMLREFLHSNDLDSDGDSPSLRRRGDLGQLAGGKNHRWSGPRTSTDSNRNSLDSSPSSSSRRPSLNESNLFGQIYYRHMCAYVLRMDKAIEEKVVSWQQMDVEDDAPEDIILYSIVAGRGELIMFGGMRSDGGNGLGDCLNVGMDRHLLLSDTFLLRPRYSDM